MPSTSTPEVLTVVPGVTTPVSGIVVTDPDGASANESFTVDLTDSSGLLSASGAGVSGSGSTHLSISGSLSDVMAALSTLSYFGAVSGSDSIEVLTTDGRGGSDDHLIAVTINAPPVTAVPSFLTVQPNVATPVTGVSIIDTDADSLGETITVTLTGSIGSLSAIDSAVGGGGTITGAGTAQLVISGTLDQVNADLSTLSYSGNGSSDSIDVATGDGRGGSDDHHINVTINAPPHATVPQGAQLVQQGVATAIPGVSVSDTDAVLANEIITVTLSDTLGLLSATGAGISGSGTTHLTVTGSLGQVNFALLSSLKYQSPTFGTDTIDAATSDGRGGSDDEKISVFVNAPPATKIPGAQSVQQGIAATITGVSIKDQDAASANETITVNLTDASGLLSANAGAPGGGGAIAGAGTSKLTISGTLDQVNADLTTLSYINSGFGTDSIDVATSDSDGGSDDHKIAVNTNARPTIVAPTTTLLVQQKTPTQISVISIDDGDAVSANETITVVLTAAGTLSASASPPGGGKVSGSGKSVLTITGTLSQVNADLMTLTYVGNKSGSDSIDVASTDSRGGSDDKQINVSVNAPLTTTGVPGTLAVQSGGLQAIAGIRINDADGTGETFTVTLSDTLGLLLANTLLPGGGGTISGNGTKTLTISGTLTQVNADLLSLRYTTSSFGVDSIDVASSDGRGSSDDHKIAVTVNAPPTILNGGSSALAQQGVSTPLLGFSVADQDAASASETIAVTLTDTAGTGALSATTNASGGGGKIKSSGKAQVVITGTLAQVNADLTTLTYLNNTFGTDTVDMAVTDGRGGSDDLKINVRVNAPAVAILPAAQLVQEDVATPISGVSIQDQDGTSADSYTVTFTENQLHTTFSVNTSVPGGGGSVFSSSGSLVMRGTLAQLNADLSTLTYQSSFGSGNVSVTVEVDDEFQGVTTQQLSLSVNSRPGIDGQTPQFVKQGIAAPIPVRISDADPQGTYTVTLRDAGGTLAATVKTTGGGGKISGSGTKLLTVTGTESQVNADLATLTYLNAATGADTILLSVDDGRGGSNAGSIAVGDQFAFVTQVVSSPASGELTAGQTARFTLDMSQSTVVTGAPLLLLNDGGTAIYDAARSTATSLVFDYPVTSNQVTTDLRIIGIQMGIPIRDLSGGQAMLENAGADLSLQVNTTGTGPAPAAGGNFAINGPQELELFGPSTANVTFASGARGTLKLDDSGELGGQVSGFTVPDAIDLSDIIFGSSDTLAYAANSGNAGGTLTVSDGTHTARIALLGQYSASSFAMASDGHLGTLITDPPPAAQQSLVSPSS